MTDNKIVLIDLSSIARPIFEAAYPKDGGIACATEMVARVRALASAHQHVAICCDSGRSFRHDLDGNYKANRSETPGTYLHQMQSAVETLRGDGYAVWSEPGYEADDLIATAAARVSDANSKAFSKAGPGTGPVQYLPDVLIISADKDLTQLVSERVTQFKPANGSTLEKTYDVAEVEKTFGVAPHQMVDWLSLVGDKSDNIIGAKDIGPVKAAKLLATFGNLDDLYAAVDAGQIAVPPAQFTSLLEFRPRWPLVRQLITLRTDAPIAFEEVFRERVPAEVETFSGDDIDFAMQPLEEVKREEANVKTYSIPAGQQAAVVTLPPPINESVYESVYVRQPEVVNGQVDWEKQLEPRNLTEAKQMAESLFVSKLFSAYGHPAGILSTIIAGRELGYPAMASLRAFHIIENKQSMSADFVRGLVLKSGLLDYLRCTERTAERATFAIKRKGDPEFVMSFTMAEAHAAGIVKPNSGWTKWPTDMLVARCSIKICRLVVPEISHGMYEPSEVER